jgi:hypothetical protein
LGRAAGLATGPRGRLGSGRAAGLHRSVGPRACVGRQAARLGSAVGPSGRGLGSSRQAARLGSGRGAWVGPRGLGRAARLASGREAWVGPRGLASCAKRRSGREAWVGCWHGHGPGCWTWAGPRSAGQAPGYGPPGMGRAAGRRASAGPRACRGRGGPGLAFES